MATEEATRTTQTDLESGEYQMSDEEFARERAALFGGDALPRSFSAGYDEASLDSGEDGEPGPDGMGTRGGEADDGRQNAGPGSAAPEADPKAEGDGGVAPGEGDSAKADDPLENGTPQKQQDKPLLVLKHHGRDVEIKDFATLRELAREGDLTLLYAAKDQEHNEAVVLQRLLSRTG